MTPDSASTGSAPAPASPTAGTAASPTPASPADDERWMTLALDLAAEAGRSGEVPVGAVAVAGGEVVATGANQKEATGDPTAHAEIVCLREAATRLGSWRLSGVTLYATLEPCPMCAGALVAARVSRVVFAAADPKAGSCGSLYNLLADPRLNHEPALTAGVLAEEAGTLLSGFFAGRRA